jgi:hypothetical protein
MFVIKYSTAQPYMKKNFKSFLSKQMYLRIYFLFMSYSIQGVFEVEAFLLTCDSMRCSKEF